MASKLRDMPMVVAIPHATAPEPSPSAPRRARADGAAETELASIDDAVAKAQSGDVAAFETLYRACIGRVHALCWRLSGDRSRAETLAQDVFVQAWQKLDTFRGHAAFTTWLHRLAVNHVLQEQRSARRRRARERIEGERRPTTEAPHRAIEAGFDLERAIAALPERARTVLVLHDIEGLAHKEIAAAMDTSVGTCKAQLHRARKMLREVLR